MKSSVADKSSELNLANAFFQELNNPSTEKMACQKLDSEIENGDFALFRIDEITFEEDAPRQEALENVLAALCIPGINIIYLIIGTTLGVKFYFGISKDLSAIQSPPINIEEIGDDILGPSLRGNFRGSLVSSISNDERQEIWDKIKNHKFTAVLDGVPGINKDQDKKDFQGVDRVVDVMRGDEFIIMLIAKPITDRKDNYAIAKELYEIYSTLAPFSKANYQSSTNEGTSTTEGTNETETTSSGKSSTTTEGKTTGTNISVSKSENETTTTNKSTSLSVNMGQTRTTSETTSAGESSSKTKGTNLSKGTQDGTSWQKGVNTSKGTSSNGTKRSTSESGGESKSDGGSHSTSESAGTSTSTTTGTNTGRSSSVSNGTSESKGSSESSGSSQSTSSGESVTNGTSQGTNKSVSTAENEGKSYSAGTQQSSTKNIGTGLTASTEFINKEAQEWLKYFDEVLFPRLDYGLGKGLFVVSTCLFAENPKVLLKLGNTMKSIFSGESGNRVPLSVCSEPSCSMIKCFKAFQQPLVKDNKMLSGLSRHAQIAKSHCVLPAKINDTTSDRMFLGNWMSSGELGILAGIPRKEIVGMKLKEEVEFGLNITDNFNSEKKVHLGSLVQSGQVNKSVPVEFPVSILDRHVFIAGVTGSGKTNTSEKILIESKLPFLVIEPAKTEYRSMKNDHFKDLLVFTLGIDSVAPFRLNPFEILPGENITSRVDMIKASIEAAFDMEAAIPQIIEAAIYECYEDYGWDIQTNKNDLFDNPFADGVFAFPTIEEVINQTEQVVKKQGFDERLKNDYIGSIKARLKGLTVGSKGLMLNCRRSLDFETILDRKVVLELEEIRSGSEKSLIIGFVLINLLESIKHRYRENKNQKYNHITMIEEAHRLLSRCEPGDSPNKKHAVETFADMLAEIRKYGESLIIADQIPNKLTPEVLKNTNTKIVHRLFAQDDKDAIGSTMSLSDDQRNFLSNLKIGRAIMFTGEWDKAIQVEVEELKTKDDPIDPIILRKAALELYAESYKRGIIDCSELFSKKPSVEEMEKLLEYVNMNVCRKEFAVLLSDSSSVKANRIKRLVQAIELCGEGFLDQLLRERYREHAATMKDPICRILHSVRNGETPDPDDYSFLKSYN